ncbi:MAG: hypothetical protein LWW85_12225 [Marinilabiliales bacterium]|nr:hypothetical protein [Marinilabiliales bacterium]
MKAKFLFLFLLLLAAYGYGQDGVSKPDSLVRTRKNVVKFLPVNLPFNSLSFEYERKFNAKNSFIIGVGIPSPQPFASKFNLTSSDNKISNDEFGVLAIRAAYRHYTGHHLNPSGFYISPYLKYQKFDIKADNYRTKNGTTHYNEHYEINANTMSLGFQLGYQFLIAKTVAIDLYFLGIEAGLANATAVINTTDTGFIDDVYSGVNDNIADFPSFLRDKITVTKGTSKVDVKASSVPFPWLRSGISIGIAF